MGNYLDILIVGFSVFGGLFGLLGSYGLIKLNDPVSRLHAPTMTSTLGVGAILLASFFHSWAYDNQGSSHELLILIFLLLTAPVTAKFIAKVHISRHTNPDDLPRPGDDRVWASHMNCDESGVPPQQQG
ncbi:MAG: monovalent cation/H(+) antiporter subunit G [Epibacterium sp.]|nr:monovalent cation/H(+) antiporter subunit G [Epibacterium sp.]NQX73140.1 monovalent cation/H(+) antiporter subunit G [Epibacterium sp.]